MSTFERFDVAENAEVINKKIELANVLQLEVEADDVQKLVDYVEGELSNEDLVELEEQRKLEELENENEETNEVQKKFTTKGLGSAFAKINEGV